MLLYGIIVTLPCLLMAIWPARQAKAIAERLASGDDRFFEEQRTYRAYPWMRNVRHIRMVGIVGTLCGVLFCLIQVIRA